MAESSKRIATLTLAALFGFVAAISAFKVAEAHWESNPRIEDWDWHTTTPDFYGDDNYFYPLDSIGNDIYKADDGWDGISTDYGINIAVLGKKTIAASADVDDVPDDEVWITDYWVSCSRSDHESGLCEYGLASVDRVLGFHINHALIEINEDNDISWNWSSDSTVDQYEIDMRTVLAHEYGHAVGMRHHDGYYGWCANTTSSSSNYDDLYPMCSAGGVWTGTSSVARAGHIPDHETDIDDYQEQYDH